jgi:hypothetical protein
MPPKTTSLPNIPDLAGETRQQIFGLAGLPSKNHTINSGPAPNIVEVKFTRYPSFRRKGRGHPWRLVWTYNCKPWTVSPLLSTSVESRATYIRDNPDTLQLNRGTPVVRYNATRDTVYIDAESFFNLWHYVTVHRAQSRGNIPIGNLRGFPAIQVLGSFRSGLAEINIVGLANLRIPAEQVLTDLTQIRRLGERGRHPGGRDPATLQLGQRPFPRRLVTALTHVLDDFENSRSFNGPQWRNEAQWNLIDAARDAVENDVDAFWAEAQGVLGIPVTL